MKEDELPEQQLITTLRHRISSVPILPNRRSWHKLCLRGGCKSPGRLNPRAAVCPRDFVPFLGKTPIMAQNCATGSDSLDFGTEFLRTAPVRACTTTNTPPSPRTEISVPFLGKTPIMAQKCATGSDFLDFGTEFPRLAPARA